MEFDRSRVYSSVNADELKAGDMILVANTMADLKAAVRKDYKPVPLSGVAYEVFECRFETLGNAYALAYLVERKENCTNCGSHEVCGYVQNVSKFACLNRCENWKPKTEKNCTKCMHYKDDYCERYKIPVADPRSWACEKFNEASGEKKYRPFKDCDELIDYWYDKTGMRHPDGLIYGVSSLTMPLIWVRRKEGNSKGQLITEFSDSLWVGMGKEAYNMTDLLVHFTFLDGSPCGVEE